MTEYLHCALRFWIEEIKQACPGHHSASEVYYLTKLWSGRDLTKEMCIVPVAYCLVMHALCIYTATTNWVVVESIERMTRVVTRA
jgi:hypothetical protein